MVELAFANRDTKQQYASEAGLFVGYVYQVRFLEVMRHVRRLAL